MTEDLSFESFKKEALKNPGIKKEYDVLEPVFELRRKLIRMRTEKGMTQEQLAKKMGTKRSNISRLEGGGDVSFPTLKTISKYAEALGYKVTVEFKPV
ncbi:MAG: helix-turn-helix domain-containing protein [Desulfotignum sp.]|nr:helix-turn-helix domain-containing protein [Desulfobacteraceae bacterium]